METIMIIDEQKTFREGFKTLIELKFGHKFVIVEASPEKLPKLKKRLKPKLIITNQLEHLIAEGYLHEMKELGTKVVLLGLESSNIGVDTNVHLCDGYLLKNMETKHLLTVLEEIMESENIYVHPEIAYHILKIFRRNQTKTACT